MKIVIIGTGMAGYGLAKEIRKQDKVCRLLLVTADSGESYPKPMLSNALINNRQPEDIVSATAEEMAQRLDAEILTNTRINRIDTTDRKLVTDRDQIDYDRLVLATGASPIRLPLPGNAADRILSVNNLDDYRAFRQRLSDAGTVLIIGPGLIGCEFANDLAVNGKRVHLVGPDHYPVSTLLPKPAGLALQAGLEAIGVQFHLQQVTERIDHDGDRFQVTLTDGTQLQADLVLSAVGLRPELSLAETAGLKTNRGIVTNRFLESSVESIYAIGDALEVAGLNLPFVMPLMNASRALAKTLTGTPTELVYPAMPVAIKTPAHPVTVASPPLGREGEWQSEGDHEGIKALFHSASGELLGFVLTGNRVDEKAALTKQLPPTLGH